MSSSSSRMTNLETNWAPRPSSTSTTSSGFLALTSSIFTLPSPSGARIFPLSRRCREERFSTQQSPPLWSQGDPISKMKTTSSKAGNLKIKTWTWSTSCSKRSTMTQTKPPILGTRHSIAGTTKREEVGVCCQKNALLDKVNRRKQWKGRMVHPQKASQTWLRGLHFREYLVEFFFLLLFIRKWLDSWRFLHFWQCETSRLFSCLKSKGEGFSRKGQDWQKSRKFTISRNSIFPSFYRVRKLADTEIRRMSGWLKAQYCYLMRNSSRFNDPCCDESIVQKSLAKDVLCENWKSASITGKSKTNSRILAWKCLDAKSSLPKSCPGTNFASIKNWHYLSFCWYVFVKQGCTPFV